MPRALGHRTSREAMPAHQAPQPRTGDAWLYEIKHDGFRVIVSRTFARLFRAFEGDDATRHSLVGPIRHHAPRRQPKVRAENASMKLLLVALGLLATVGAVYAMCALC
jgi:hypothetical protein